VAGGVFICYRREDSAGFAGRIYDRLVSRLPSGRVFFDVDNIEPGLDFVKVLSDRVGDCDALVAIIGEDWLTARDEDNNRRIDDPHDFVRIEIETALQRDVRVIPVLINGARLPRAIDLPDPLKALARRQAIEISHSRFDTDSERLTRALERALEDHHPAPPDPKQGDVTQEHPRVEPIAKASVGQRPILVPLPKPDPAEKPAPQIVTPSAGAKPFLLNRLAIIVAALALIGVIAVAVIATHQSPPVVTAGQLSVTEIADFSATEGESYSASSERMTLIAAGPGFDWSLAGDSPNWLALSPSRGHLADNGRMDVVLTLTPAASSLSAGKYEAKLVFKNEASGASVERLVRLIVAARSKLHRIGEDPIVAPGQLSVSEFPDFTGSQGGPFSPTEATITLTAKGTGFNWSLDLTDFPPWLQSDQYSGHLGENESKTLTFSLSGDFAVVLPPGQHKVPIHFKNDASGLSIVRVVHLNVSPRLKPPPDYVGMIEPPLPVRLGDTYEKIKAAYSISETPEPFISQGKQDGTELRLAKLGIWFFFDDSGKIRTIRLDAPFSGALAGIKIGDPKEKLEPALGKGTDAFSGIDFSYGPTLKIVCDLLSGKVETIFLFGR